MKRNNHEADFLFGCFAKIYGAIKSLVFGNFLTPIYGILRSSRCAFGLTGNILLQTKAPHLFTVRATPFAAIVTAKTALP